MEREEIYSAIEQISVRHGGNVFREKKLTEHIGKNACIFIGLGGLGGRAINEIKAAADEKMEDSDLRFYLAIDVCRSDMESISKYSLNSYSDEESYGKLEPSEMFCLCDYNYPFKHESVDDSMRKWINPNLFESEICNDILNGAVRQTGRMMLFNGDNYDRVKKQITRVLEEVFLKMRTKGGNRVNIYIVSGLCGSTGGGIIVDISYMIRNIISMTWDCYFKIEGCLFTPDVQLNDLGISNCPEHQMVLKSNFYAAIKEIDYFYNNSERKNVYKPPVPGEHDRCENIFDECRLISAMDSDGNRICQNSNEVISKFADAVVYENNKMAENETMLSYYAFEPGRPYNIKTWLYTDIAQSMKLPDWAPFRYSAFGYGSFYIPSDELFAYCANRLMERLCKEWSKRNISEEILERKIAALGLKDGRTFASKLFDIAGCNQAFEVDRNLVPKDPIGPGPVWHVDKYISELDNVIVSTTASTSMTRYFQAAIGRNDSVLKQEFTDKIIQWVDTAFYDDNQGPAYAINLLSAAIDKPEWFEYYNEGILDKIERIIVSVSMESKEWLKELSIVHDELMLKAEKLKQFKIGQHDSMKLYEFIDGYVMYAKDMLKAHLLRESEGYLQTIRDIVEEKCQQLFNVYTATLNGIIKTLQKDSQYVLDKNRRKPGRRNVVRFDVTNFENDDPVTQRIIEFFNEVVDSKDIDAELKLFNNKVFGKIGSMYRVKDEEANLDMVKCAIKDYFNSTFSEWVKYTKEKLCYIAYSNRTPTRQEVSNVFEDYHRETLVQTTRNIVESLRQKTRVLLPSADPMRNVENFNAYMSVNTPQETQLINENIRQDHTFVLGMLYGKEFIWYKHIIGFPLFLLGGLREYRECYESITFPGQHLDEGVDSWRNFPEPYSYPAAVCVGAYNDDGSDVTEKDRNILKEILKDAKVALEYGLLSVMSTDDGYSDEYYSLTYRIINEPDEQPQEVYEKIKMAYSDAEEKDDFIGVLQTAGYRMGEPIELNWNAINPYYYIIGEKTEMGDDKNFGNFIKIVYSNVDWRKYLHQAVITFGKYRDAYEKVKKGIES